MIQLFLRARAHNYFKSRSSDRDSETDRARVAAIADAIDNALLATEAERAGLSHRVDDVLARAAITMGNASDEYLTRDPKDSAQQDRFGIEIQNGQKRLKELEATMSHFKFLKVALTSRFPDFKRQPIGLEDPTPRPPQAAASRDGETS
jgi:hypothetical protein